MSVVSHRLPITVDWQRISADNIYAAAAVHMNPPEAGMFSNKGSRKQCQDLGLGNVAYQADIQKAVLIPGLRTKFYPASFLLHVHSGEKVKSGQPVNFFFIDPDRHRTAPIIPKQLQCDKDIGKFTQMQSV